MSLNSANLQEVGRLKDVLETKSIPSNVDTRIIIRSLQTYMGPVNTLVDKLPQNIRPGIREELELAQSAVSKSLAKH